MNRIDIHDYLVLLRAAVEDNPEAVTLFVEIRAGMKISTDDSKIFLFYAK